MKLERYSLTKARHEAQKKEIIKIFAISIIITILTMVIL